MIRMIWWIEIRYMLFIIGQLTSSRLIFSLFWMRNTDNLSGKFLTLCGKRVLQSCTFIYLPAENITLLHFTHLQTNDDYLLYLLELFTNVAFKLALIVSWRGITRHYIAFVVAIIIRTGSCCNTDSNFFSSSPDNLKYKSDFLMCS